MNPERLVQQFKAVYPELSTDLPESRLWLVAGQIIAGNKIRRSDQETNADYLAVDVGAVIAGMTMIYEVFVLLRDAAGAALWTSEQFESKLKIFDLQHRARLKQIVDEAKAAEDHIPRGE